MNAMSVPDTFEPGDRATRDGMPLSNRRMEFGLVQSARVRTVLAIGLTGIALSATGACSGATQLPTSGGTSQPPIRYSLDEAEEVGTYTRLYRLAAERNDGALLMNPNNNTCYFFLGEEGQEAGARELASAMISAGHSSSDYLDATIEMTTAAIETGASHTVPDAALAGCRDAATDIRANAPARYSIDDALAARTVICARPSANCDPKVLDAAYWEPLLWGVSTGETTVPGGENDVRESSLIGSESPANDVSVINPGDMATLPTHAQAQLNATIRGLPGSGIFVSLSAKRAGLNWGGITWDYSDILAEYQELDSQYGATLVSGSHANNLSSDWYITIVGSPTRFSNMGAAQSWCDTRGLSVEYCMPVHLD